MHAQVKGRVLQDPGGEPIAGATIRFQDTGTRSDSLGWFTLPVKEGTLLTVSAVAHETVRLRARDGMQVNLVADQKELEAVVVSGTLKAITRLQSPVPVEVYSSQFLKKNPAPSIFESLQQVNGVRPQLNCSVCNTGDIHMNGLEGPYTMVSIDGMPIVSGLASVYGLFGIPTQMIDRVEVVRGPASGLYGSEAIGGLINIITKTPERSPAFSADLMSTNWLEHSVDLGSRYRLGKKVQALTGLNYFYYGDPRDHNGDGFTDVTLQHRASLFNKFTLKRRAERQASLAARVFMEDRWGGEMNWNKTFRGSDSVYGENIKTRRWELIGQYQLPFTEKMHFSFSATRHRQDSWYGNTPYFGDQRINFGQLTWEPQFMKEHRMLSGIAMRHNFYDDNSTATRDTATGMNRPEKYLVPGLFIQDEWDLSPKHVILLGARVDHHRVHGLVFTPRFAWKWNLPRNQVLRINAGTGFRVVNLFTEDHAALTGARSVEIAEALRPEKSYNANINFTRSFKNGPHSGLIEWSAWYSHFNNQIIADYEADPRKIVYDNLSGHARSMGTSLNLDLNIHHRLRMIAGVTLQDVARYDDNGHGGLTRRKPLLVEDWTGTWLFSYTWPAEGFNIDYTGNVYGPMSLPRLSALDPRPGRSPVWSIQNIQFTKKLGSRTELYGGIKNLLNWTPAKNIPFLLARTHDPFDKEVEYEADGSVKVTPGNPYGLKFDPAYVYAPNQGRRLFLGCRFTIK